jgi:hypothetical protein
MLTESEITRIAANPAPRPGDTLEVLAAKLQGGRIVKGIRNLEAADALNFEPGSLYSIAVLTGSAELARVDETYQTILDGLSVEFLTSDVFVSVTAVGNPAMVTVVIY